MITHTAIRATLLRTAAAMLLLAANHAFAAYNCTLSVNAITANYVPTNVTDNVSSSTFTVSCTRLITDAATLNYNVRVNNGVQPTGALNRVQFSVAANRYTYETFRNPPYTNANRWQNTAALQIAGTINFGAGLSGMDTRPFDLVITGNQTERPAGSYTDTVLATLRNAAGGATLATANLSVTANTVSLCQITTPPGNLTFTYTSFQVGIANASTGIAVRCTPSATYGLDIGAASSSLLGLTYTLGLSATSATGTGVAQAFTISGAIAAAQVGTCASGSCSGSQGRTLTITY